MVRESKAYLRLFKKIAKIMAPPPELTVSEWADSFRRLSSESSAEPGRWNTERAPYQREIMDAVNDSEVDTVVIMSSSQVGKTEFLLNIIGYHIDYDPSPVMVIQPTVEMAKTFSKTRLAPMLRDTPALRGKVADARSRDSGNTVLEKAFPGGYIVMVGANAPSSLASRPIRILLADEVDRFPLSAGTEGDPLTLAEKRTTTFAANRKKVYVSTPTVKGVSRIEKAFENSTKEHWNVPCPSCGIYQPYRFKQISFESISMWCIDCGSLHTEHEWKAEKGKWIAENPNHKIRGFHLNEFASPWKRWSQIIEDFKEAKKGGQEMFKAWVNTSLGETWEEKGDGLESDNLISRREEYFCEVPEDVLVLTAGVDVQDNRLEYEVVGWGIGKESWGIRYGVIMGDPGQTFVWNELDQALTKIFIRKDGLKLQIMSTCVDSGGHHTKQVYDYCKQREFQRIWAIKGRGGSGVPYIQRPKNRNASGTWLFTIGVDVGKDMIVSRLKSGADQDGYCHFPIEQEKGYDEQYFEGLTAEHRVIRSQHGQSVVKWEKKTSSARNEPFDLRNYASAALEIINPNFDALRDQMNKSSNLNQTIVKKQGKKRRRILSKGLK